MIFGHFFAKLAGKFAAKKLKLEDGPMEGTKSWYKSKTLWSDIVTVLVGIVGLVDTHFTGGHIATSPAYSIVLTFLGAVGFYGRKNADTKIG